MQNVLNNGLNRLLLNLGKQLQLSHCLVGNLWVNGRTLNRHINALAKLAWHPFHSGKGLASTGEVLPANGLALKQLSRALLDILSMNRWQSCQGQARLQAQSSRLKYQWL
jgi:hypothetical protein